MKKLLIRLGKFMLYPTGCMLGAAFLASPSLATNGFSPSIPAKTVVVKPSPVDASSEYSHEKSAGEIRIEVSGTVTSSSDGQGIPGVSVLIKGTGSGTVTEVHGTYTIDVPHEDGILVVSSIGYVSQDGPVDGRTIINITLTEDVQGLEEVVVVGYGTQQKANLTGSVSSVGSELLSKRHASQASQLLQGVTSGVTATQTSGEPGQDAASLKIRGLGTFSGAGTNPLVIVDGVHGSINAVNPYDIVSISVLNDDVSACNYGTRDAYW